MLNPWILLGLVMAFLGVGAGSFGAGHHFGVTTQKVADQVQFDAINDQTAENKKKADAIYRNAQAIIIQQAADRELADNQREKERQSDVKTINDLRNRYASVGLRFSTGQASGLGGSGGNSNGISAHPADNDGTAEIQLPDQIAEDLRQLTFDDDAVKVDYAILYKWAHDPNLCLGRK